MSESVAERVYSDLYEAIRSQRLPPSTALPEAELAKRYKVSRTPIREATSRLIQDGLIERQGSSYVVRQLSLNEVAEIYPIINVLEGLAALSAASRATKKDLAHLEALQEAMRSESVDGSADFVDINQEFHDAIIAAGRNPTLGREIERFRVITNHFRTAVLSISHRRSQSVAEHEAILSALKDGDGAAAEAAMRSHIHTAEELLMALLRAGALVAPRPVPNRTKTKIAEPGRARQIKSR